MVRLDVMWCSLSIHCLRTRSRLRKIFKTIFTSDLGYYICTWLSYSLDDNKLIYKYNPKAVIDALWVDKDLNLALYKPNLVS